MMTDDEMAESVRCAVKAQGCICRPDITISHPDPDVPLYVEAAAAHANWCPLALARNRRNS